MLSAVLKAQPTQARPVPVGALPLPRGRLKPPPPTHKPTPGPLRAKDSRRSVGALPLRHPKILQTLKEIHLWAWA